MAKGTKYLRQAAVVLLGQTKKRIESIEERIITAKDKSTDGMHRSIEEWIIISWELEKQLLENQIETLEKWIIEDEYNY
jgi:hypothetical protein